MVLCCVCGMCAWLLNSGTVLPELFNCSNTTSFHSHFTMCDPCLGCPHTSHLISVRGPSFWELPGNKVSSYWRQWGLMWKEVSLRSMGVISQLLQIHICKEAFFCIWWVSTKFIINICYITTSTSLSIYTLFTLSCTCLCLYIMSYMLLLLQKAMQYLQYNTWYNYEIYFYSQ